MPVLFWVLIAGVSMEPTLLDGERYPVVAIDSLQAGDIVVAHWKPGRWLTKRVVAVAGDTLAVSVARLSQGAVVPKNKYIILSDNPADSFDSRILGPLDYSTLRGRVLPKGAP